MTSPPSATAGWYPDGQLPGLLRWFDGTRWTDWTAMAGAQPPGVDVRRPVRPGVGVSVLPGGQVTPPVLHPLPAGPAVPTPRTGDSPSDPVHWLLPTGRTWQSIVAGYLGLFATVVWILGPLALGFGVAGLRASASGHGHGRIRAWFAVVSGALSSLALVLLLARTL